MKTLLAALIVLLAHITYAQEIDPSLFNGMEPRNIGPAGMSGRITAIDVVLDDPDIIYIGSAAGGVWKSVNGGYNWSPIFDDQPTLSIGAIAIYQKNPNILYVGTGEGNPRNSQNSGRGMFKSTDGGRTWMHIGLDSTRQIHRVIVHPDNPDIVIAGAQGSAWGDHEQRGVYLSTDGGSSWQRTLYVNDSTGVADLRMDPSNPNRLLAAMWQFRRNAWFFSSGGGGSGLYLSEDGGRNWKKLDCNSGLPCGDLGRIGIAFAPSQPDIVYAYVEAEENGIYRSEDGGYSWEKRSTPKDKKIGDRPFYYADLYVDVINPNRVYSIATAVTVSDDGGVTWEDFAPADKIHTDHHAWWSHPTNGDFIIDGNDGGLYITRDRGKNWFFVENLPLAQFYHINVDDDTPYNVYGGLQDNGSWCGPAYTWTKGGLRNMFWQRLGAGDGFDVVPDPTDNNYGYSMAQAGHLMRYHRPTGQIVPIMPVDEDDEYLRFNWNAGIAADPFNRETIYYGSQYLHRSTDRGRSWETISPDLTTNDPAKQEFLESGGLTYDVTGAEFHTSIVTIAPSNVEQGVIWVGTDDGNIQLTRDGGQTWTLLHGTAAGTSPASPDTSSVSDTATVSTSANASVSRTGITGVPAGTWVPQIHPSSHSASEAFVVFDDHRRNNWEPYVFRTTDFGNSWTRVVDAADVEGFAYAFCQDTEVPHLWFCGTDAGLFFTLDSGTTWNQWSAGYPAVPTMDLVMHPRNGDLVIGTFGRSAWVLDDIGPLRELAASPGLRKNPLHLFQLPDAYLSVQGEAYGYRNNKVGDFLYAGENKPYGALITFYTDEIEGDSDTVAIQIKNSEDIIVRNLEVIVESKGIHRTSWDLSRNAPRQPDKPRPEETEYYKGKRVPPGAYEVTVRRGATRASASLFVIPDARLRGNARDYADKDVMIVEYQRLVSLMTAVADEIRTMEKGLAFARQRARDMGLALDDPRYTVFKDELEALKARLFGPDVEGIYRPPDAIISILNKTGNMLDILDPVSPNQQLQLEHAKDACAGFSVEWDQFKYKRLPEMRRWVSEKGISIF